MLIDCSRIFGITSLGRQAFAIYNKIYYLKMLVGTVIRRTCNERRSLLTEVPVKIIARLVVSSYSIPITAYRREPVEIQPIY
jgi:hypothetical protein